MLLAAGATPSLEYELNPISQLDLAAVNSAAYLGSQDALVALLDYKLKIPVRCLSLAASSNHLSCIRIVLERLQARDFADASRLEGIRAALERAALCWHAHTVDLLLTHVEEFPGAAVLQDKRSLGRALCSALAYYDCDNGCRSPIITYEPDMLSQKDPLSRTLQWLLNSVVTIEPEDLEAAFWSLLGYPLVPRSVILYLLKKGLSVTGTTDNTHPPLLGIIRDDDDDPSLISIFTATGASVTATDSNLNTALHETPHCSFAKVLLESGASVGARNSQGETPLHRACARCNIELAEFLLLHGSDVDEISTCRQWTPLLYAVYGTETWPHYGDSQGRLELAEFLIRHGADMRKTAVHGVTALHLAAEYGEVELVLFLIDQGADVCAATTAGRTILHAACSNSQATRSESKVLIVLEMLWSHGAGADLEARDEAGKTPLQLSYANHTLEWSPDLSNALLKRGANVTVADMEGKTFAEWVTASKW